MSDDGYSSLEEDLAPNTQVHSHTASTSVIKNEPDALVGHGDSPPIAPISDGSSIGGNRAPLRDAGEKAGSEKSGSDGGTKKNSTQIDEKIFREIEERVHRRKLQRIKERQLGRQTGIDEELESMNDWREELVAYPSCEQTEAMMRRILKAAWVGTLRHTQKRYLDVARTYEIFRCLGADIYKITETHLADPDHVDHIKSHLVENRVWDDKNTPIHSTGTSGEQSEVVRSQLWVWVRDAQCPPVAEHIEEREKISELGFSKTLVRQRGAGGAQAAPPFLFLAELASYCQFVLRYLTDVEKEGVLDEIRARDETGDVNKALDDFLDRIQQALHRSERTRAQVLRETVAGEKVSDDDFASPHDEMDREYFSEFLVSVRENLFAAARAQESKHSDVDPDFKLLCKYPLDFEKLHEADLLARETDPARLNELSIAELEALLQNIERVCARQERECKISSTGGGSSSLLPACLGALLSGGEGGNKKYIDACQKESVVKLCQNFFSRNKSARESSAQASVESCVERALVKMISFQAASVADGISPGDVGAKRRGKDKKLVVFGLSKDGNKADQARSPVIMMVHPVHPAYDVLEETRGGAGAIAGAAVAGTTKDDSGFEVRSYGCRLAGSYRRICAETASAQLLETASADVETVFLEWIPAGQVEEDAVPLLELLASERITHVRLFPPQQSEHSGEDEPVEVSLQDPLDLDATSSSYQGLCSQPCDSAHPDLGSFRRFVMQVGRDPTIPLPEALMRCKTGLIEQPEIIALCLSIYIASINSGQGLSEEELCRQLEEKPDLLFFASPYLLNCIADKASAAVRKYYTRALKMGKWEMMPSELESREMLLKLLSENDEKKRIAIMPTSHVGALTLALEETNYDPRFKSVDCQNFEACKRYFEDLLELQSMTFVFVSLTSPLESEQLKELLQLGKRGAFVRTIFAETDFLMEALSAANAREYVLVCESIEKKQSSAKTSSQVVYDANNAVGAIVRTLDREFVNLQERDFLKIRDGTAGTGGQSGGQRGAEERRQRLLPFDAASNADSDGDVVVDSAHVEIDVSASQDGFLNSVFLADKVETQVALNSQWTRIEQEWRLTRVQKGGGDKLATARTISSAVLSSVVSTTSHHDAAQLHLQQLFSDGNSNFLCVISDDIDMVCKYYEEQKGVHVYDGGHRGQVEELKQVVCGLAGQRAVAAEEEEETAEDGDEDHHEVSRASDAASEEDGAPVEGKVPEPQEKSSHQPQQTDHAGKSAAPKGTSIPTFVLRDSEAIGSGDLKLIIGNCVLGNMKIIIVDTHLRHDLYAVDISLAMPNDNEDEEDTVVRPVVIEAKFCLSSMLVSVAAARRTTVSSARRMANEDAALVFGALRLLLGPSIVRKDVVSQIVSALAGSCTLDAKGANHWQKVLNRIAHNSVEGVRDVLAGILEIVEQRMLERENVIGAGAGATGEGGCGSGVDANKRGRHNIKKKPKRPELFDFGKILALVVATCVGGDQDGGAPESLDRLASFEECCVSSAPFRLLPQGCRVELWMKYLSVRVGAGIEDGPMTPGSLQLKNVHANSLVGSLLLDTAKPTARNGSSRPAYIGAGHTNGGFNAEMMMRARAEKAQSLDWNVFASEWVGKPPSNPLLLDVLSLSPDRIFVLLSLSACQIANLGNSVLRYDAGSTVGKTTTGVVEAALRRIAGDVMATYPLLTAAELLPDGGAKEENLSEDTDSTGCASRSPSSAGQRAVKERWIAIKWVLLTNLPPADKEEFERRCGVLSAAELDVLIAAGVKLSSAERPELLAKLVEMLVALDHPRDILYTQSDVRQFLLQGDFESLQVVTDDDDDGSFPRLGSAFFDFVFRSEYRQKFLSGNLGESLMGVGRSFCRKLLRFCFSDEDKMDAADERRVLSDLAHEMSAGQGSLSAAAMATLVKRARPEKLKLLVDVFLRQVLGNLPDEAKSRFMMDVIDELCREEETKVVPLLEALAAHSDVLGNGDDHLDFDDLDRPAVAQIFRSLRDNDLSNYIEWVSQAMKDAEERKKILPLSCCSSETLRDLYIARFSQTPMNDYRFELDLHSLLLPGDSRMSVFEAMHDACEQSSTTSGAGSATAPVGNTVENTSVKNPLLYWFCWASSPNLSMADTFAPKTAEHKDAFRQVLRDERVGFLKAAVDFESVLSPEAMFLLKPETLNCSMYNELAPKFGFLHGEIGDGKIQDHVFLIGQEGDATFPPYYVRCHNRPLPDERKRDICEGLQGSVGPAPDVPRAFFPRLTTGVSTETVTHNIGMLLLMRPGTKCWRAFPGQSGWNAGQENWSEQNVFFGCLICIWFMSAGFTYADLDEMVDPDQRDKLRQAWNGLRQRGTEDAWRWYFVYGPLPSYMNIVVKEDRMSDIRLFQITEDSCRATTQALNSVVRALRLTQVRLINNFSDCDIVERDGSKFRKGRRFSSALIDLGQAVGKKIAKDARELCIHHPGPRPTHKIEPLLERYGIIAEFTNQLSASQNPQHANEGRRMVVEFFQNFVRGLSQESKKMSGPTPKIVTAIVSDALFLLYGMTPHNRAVEIHELFARFNKEELALGAQVIKEIRWMKSHVYAKGGTPVVGAEDIVARIDEILNKSPISQQLTKTPEENRKFIGSVVNAGPSDEYFSRAPAYLTSPWPQDFLSAKRDKEAAAQTREDESSTDQGSSSPAGTDTPDSDRPMRRTRTNYGTGDETAFDSAQPAEQDPTFFHSVSKPSPMNYSSHNVLADVQRSAASKELRAPARGCNLVNCSGLLTLESAPTNYLYGTLKVRPGQQSVLRKSPSNYTHLNYYRHLSAAPSDLAAGRKAAASGGNGGSGGSGGAASGAKRSGQRAAKSAGNKQGAIEKVFANNAEVWEFLRRQPAHTVLQANGFYLRKTTTGELVPVFPAQGKKNDTCLASLVDSHLLFGQELDGRVKVIANLLIWAAYEMVAKGDAGGGEGADAAGDPNSAPSPRRRPASGAAEDGNGNGDWDGGEDWNEDGNWNEDDGDDAPADGAPDWNETGLPTDEDPRARAARASQFARNSSLKMYVPQANSPDQNRRLRSIEEASRRRGDPDLPFTFEEYLKTEKTLVETLKDLFSEVKRSPGRDVYSTVKTHFQRKLTGGPNGLDGGGGSCSMTSSFGNYQIYVPFLHQTPTDGVQLSAAGVQLANELKNLSVSNKDEAQQQLRHLLEVAVGKDKIIGPHQKITQQKFKEQARQHLAGVKKCVELACVRRTRRVDGWTKDFSDSEAESSDDELDEGGGDGGDDGVCSDAERDEHLLGSGGLSGGVDPLRSENKMFAAEDDDSAQRYVDTELDRSREHGGCGLFPAEAGYGRPVHSAMVPLSCAGYEDLPFYWLAIDHDRLEEKYTTSDGLVVGYLLSKEVLRQLLEEAPVEDLVTVRAELLAWIVNILRSRLSENTKAWILRVIREPRAAHGSPPQDMHHKNLAVVLYCLISACPADTPALQALRKTLRHSFEVCGAPCSTGAELEDLIQRRNSRFGVYIAASRVKLTLEELGFKRSMAVRNYATSRENSQAIFIDIVHTFDNNPYCCIVYVQGLPRVPENLLKWVAEYTRFNPWRFVYFENSDVSWNYPEVRDRCNFTFAPQNPAHRIRSPRDLEQDPYVVMMRPSHEAEYDSEALPNREQAANSVELTQFFRDQLGPRYERKSAIYFGADGGSGGGASGGDRDGAQARAGGRRRRRNANNGNGAAGSGGQGGGLLNGLGRAARAVFGAAGGGDTEADDDHDEEPPITPVRTTGSASNDITTSSCFNKPNDFRKIMRQKLIEERSVSGILLQAPPGIGKTFSVENELRPELERKLGAKTFSFDASSKTLVEEPIAELLNRTIQAGGASGGADSAGAEEDGAPMRVRAGDVGAAATGETRTPTRGAPARGGGGSGTPTGTAGSVAAGDGGAEAGGAGEQGQESGNSGATSAIYLFVDEYHYLKEEQKYELSRWLAEHANQVVAVLVANRIESRDRERMRQLPGEWLLIETRLTEEKIVEVARKHGIEDDSAMQINVLSWFRGSRLIFGDESVSLRLIQELQRVLQGGAVRPDRLEALLAQKVPTASRCCVAQFTAAFLADRRLGGGGGHEGALGCLYKVAKLDDEDHLFSFPEFLDRFSELYSHPPVVRMLAWCCYAVRASGVMEKMDLSAILGYEYVDQIGLPFLLESPSEKGHAQGRAFSWKGDYGNEDEMIEAVTRGHSINWNDVGRKRWAKHDIQNPEFLARLLSLVRNPSVPLKQVQPRNLCNLLDADPARGVEISRYIIKYAAHVDSISPSEEHCPFAKAVWTQLQHDETIATVEDLVGRTDPDAAGVRGRGLSAARGRAAAAAPVGGGERGSSGGTMIFGHSTPKLVYALKWAREFAGSLRSVSADDARNRDALLVDLLERVSEDPGASPNDVSDLWSGVFARLLRVPEQGSSSILSVHVLRRMLRHRADAEPAWAPAVRHLSQVLRGTACAQVVNALWQKPETRFLLLATNGGSPGGASSRRGSDMVPIDADVCAGLAQICGGSDGTAGRLDLELQLALLKRRGKVPRSVAPLDFVSVVSDGLRAVTKGEISLESDIPGFEEEIRKACGKE